MSKAREGYRWRDKDPVIDLVRTAFLAGQRTISEVARDARVSPKTLENWLYGVTVRPQNYTVGAVFDALGVTTERRSRESGHLVVVEEAAVRHFARGRRRKKRRAA